ncbi:MAG: CAP domain-containing protein [Acidobacteriaceae bacterium]|nr:CAP domain-containing protein [Acidobacteriaceae bacterium]
MKFWASFLFAPLLVVVAPQGGAQQTASHSVSASQLAPRTVAEQYLFQAANAERQQRGLPLLHWDAALYKAAEAHAEQMLARQSISHQYEGEPSLTERGELAGAKFSVIAENVAMAPTAVRIHDAWMHSPGHRANLLNGNVDAVAIRVLESHGELYAVEDFEKSVVETTLPEQELRIGQDILQQAGGAVALAADGSAEQVAARQSCGMTSGYAGDHRPLLVLRFTTVDLQTLPEALNTALASGKYREAAVGACTLQSRQAFTAFQLAVLLF